MKQSPCDAQRSKNSKGDLFEHEGKWWYCYKSSGFYTEDGLSFGLLQDQGFVPGDHCFARPATEQEINSEKAVREKLEITRKADT